MSELILHIREALQDCQDPKEKIRIFAHEHFVLIQQNPHLAQVFQVELRQSQRFIREYRPEKLWEYLSILGDAIREGQDLGVIRSDIDPFLLQWSFFGALDELSIQWVLSRRRERFNLKLAAKQIADVFINGLVSTHPT
jgi:TetR/AcrR family fatty acid metabolism transcriptional regulator